ncbi:hypothetical protein [Nocardia camponoti]|nr:hypothetical protein [Nocardia camponoti]
MVMPRGARLWLSVSEGAQHGLFIEDRPRFVSEVSTFIDGVTK